MFGRPWYWNVKKIEATARLVKDAVLVRPTPPELVHSRRGLGAELSRQCDVLRLPYAPTFWMPHGHSQTLMGAFFRTRPSQQVRQVQVRGLDGGHFSVDYVECPELDEGAPALIIFPGLTGSSQSKYIRHFAEGARQAGLRPVVFVYRGYRTALTSPMVTTSVEVSDLLIAIDSVQKVLPLSTLYAIGFSMGANMLVKAIGQRCMIEGAGRTPLAAAVSVSNAFDYPKLARCLASPVNELLYSRPLAYMVKRNITMYGDNVRMLSECTRVDPRMYSNAQTLYAIDDTLSRHLYGSGFKSTEAYYQASSSLPYVQHVDIPLLCLNAADDPFAGSIPFDAFRRNENILLALTSRGGHVAWTQGANPTNRSWMIDASFNFIENVARHLNQPLSPLSSKP